MGEMCAHGLAGFCPDCAPDRISVGDGPIAAPHATVKNGRDGPWVVVQRSRADGSFDWFTWHVTRWGAKRAAKTYMRTGEVKGLRP